MPDKERRNLLFTYAYSTY